jgi:oxalate decarboxylase/phosphoglucose isomerase-like protein (cupin superfamily)
MPAAVPSGNYLELDASSFHYDEPSKLSHRLAEHPLFTLDSLLVLARRLPKDQVRYYYAQDVKAGSPLEGVADRHKGDLTLDEAISRIAEKKSYVFLQNLETDPEYNQLIQSVLAEVEPVTSKQDPGMFGRCGWVFLSSPGAETPYHRDHEKTFLFQIKGSKTLSVFDPRDTAVVSQSENETFHSAHTLRETVYRPEIEPKAKQFTISPGQAVYMPFAAPHWVKNHDQVSISFSVTYNTLSSRRIEYVYRTNKLLRRLGMRPGMEGVSPGVDQLKFMAMRSLLGLRGKLQP